MQSIVFDLPRPDLISEVQGGTSCVCDLKITRTNGIRPKLTEPIPLKGKPGLQRINRKGHLQAENYSTSQVIDKNTLYKTVISATYSAIPDDWTSCQLELKGITMNLRQSFEAWKTNKQE